MSGETDRDTTTTESALGISGTGSFGFENPHQEEETEPKGGLPPAIVDKETVQLGQLHVAAVATHMERYMPLLVQSTGRLGIQMDVLGWGEKLTGFAFRLRKSLEYVQELPPNDVVMFIDAFDVILLQNADVIMKKFQASGAQMIVSKDGDHPNVFIDFFMKKCFRPVGDTYINIGGWIATAGFAKELLLAMSKFGEGFSNQENDQELLARYLATNKSLVGAEILIDVNHDLFLNLYGGTKWNIGNNAYKLEDHRNDLEILPDGSLHYLPTNSYPVMLHGPCNTCFKEIFDKLNYSIPPDLDKNYTSLSHTKYFARMLSHYAKFLYGFVLKLVIAVVALVLALYFVYRYFFKKTTATATATSYSAVSATTQNPALPTITPTSFVIQPPPISFHIPS
jgi:hypothetical protein